MKVQNFGAENAPLELATATISVNGKNEVVIPALREGGRVLNQMSTQDELIFKGIDSANLLDVVFNFTDSKPFFDAGFKLTDILGTPIPNSLPEGSPRVLVYLDDAVTFWQWGKREVYPSVIRDFETMNEALIAIGTTDYFSRQLDNIQAVGLAASVSGNSVLSSVWRFATENKVSMNTAKLYLKTSNVTVRVSRVISMDLPIEAELKQERTYEEASVLYQALVKAARSTKVAGSRYFISAINGIMAFTFDEILRALECISHDEAKSMQVKSCNDKEYCFSCIMSDHLMALRKQDVLTNRAAA